MILSTWSRDTLERVGATFVEAAAGIILTAGVIDTDITKKALLAGIIATVAVVKAVAASYVDKGTPAGVVDLKP